MKLYIVDFQYYDNYEKREIDDRWVLACEGYKGVEEIMQKNFDEFARYGYKIIGYSFREITKTDNGYKVSIG